MSILVENNKAGRKRGGTNHKAYKWSVVLFDKSTNQFKEGKFYSIKHLNDESNLKLNSDYVKRIMTGYRADLSQRNKENSFIQRWGHIKIHKINEII